MKDIEWEEVLSIAERFSLFQYIDGRIFWGCSLRFEPDMDRRTVLKLICPFLVVYGKGGGDAEIQKILGEVGRSVEPSMHEFGDTSGSKASGYLLRALQKDGRFFNRLERIYRQEQQARPLYACDARCDWSEGI